MQIGVFVIKRGEDAAKQRLEGRREAAAGPGEASIARFPLVSVIGLISVARM